MEESEILAVAENQTYIQDEWLPGVQLGRSVPLGQRIVGASGGSSQEPWVQFLATASFLFLLLPPHNNM